MERSQKHKNTNSLFLCIAYIVHTYLTLLTQPSFVFAWQKIQQPSQADIHKYIRMQQYIPLLLLLSMRLLTDENEDLDAAMFDKKDDNLHDSDSDKMLQMMLLLTVLECNITRGSTSWSNYPRQPQLMYMMLSWIGKQHWWIRHPNVECRYCNLFPWQKDRMIYEETGKQRDIMQMPTFKHDANEELVAPTMDKSCCWRQHWQVESLKQDFVFWW